MPRSALCRIPMRWKWQWGKDDYGYWRAGWGSAWSGSGLFLSENLYAEYSQGDGTESQTQPVWSRLQGEAGEGACGCEPGLLTIHRWGQGRKGKHARQFRAQSTGVLGGILRRECDWKRRSSDVTRLGSCAQNQAEICDFASGTKLSFPLIPSCEDNQAWIRIPSYNSRGSLPLTYSI